MRGVIQWYGGKGHMTKELLGLMPPHEHYVEVFGGGAALLFAKPPCRGTETYNDIDSGLVNFFRVLRNPETYARFERLAFLTPYSREEFDYCKATWKDCKEDVERAYRWFIIARMSISGVFGGSWSYKVSSKCFRTSARGFSFLLERLPQIHDRLRGVQIEHRDFRDLIPRHVASRTLLYCDPPYVLSTRKGPVYKYEMSDGDHKDLVDILLEYPQMVMLSGYGSPLYKTLDVAGWQKTTKQVTCYAHVGSGKRGTRIENIWLNPLAWDILHQSKQLNLF